MKEPGHDRVDLLKLDIVGAEYEVLKSIIEDHVDVKVVCVKFNQPAPLKGMVDMV